MEDIPAGVVPQCRVEAGACARIMTGALFPEVANAVVPVEWTRPEGVDHVRIEKAPKAGQFVRPAGQDVRAGYQVFEAGQVITPPVVGMLASLGMGEVLVRIAPGVAIITTGDELVPVDSVPGPGQIRDSNGPALTAQVVAAGGKPLGPFHARDTPESTREALEKAKDADVVVFAGGVSMGERDVVRNVLDEAGWTAIFWKVRQRPGKPLAFGLLDGKPVFGLPGNPVSSSVCFEQYVRPSLAKMLGRAESIGQISKAVLSEPIRKAAGLHHFVRGVAEEGEDGRIYVRPTGLQGSNLYSSMAKADGIIHLPEALENPPAGSEVDFERLRWSGR
ncbi:MAG: molybdopterin molybdotransferase MoeA [Bacteroidetes bacterium]|nr:molybdopterin molybdotransferase MoeA [Bacteroidota bacterium]